MEQRFWLVPTTDYSHTPQHSDWRKTHGRKANNSHSLSPMLEKSSSTCCCACSFPLRRLKKLTWFLTVSFSYYVLSYEEKAKGRTGLLSWLYSCLDRLEALELSSWSLSALHKFIDRQLQLFNHFCFTGSLIKQIEKPLYCAGSSLSIKVSTY